MREASMRATVTCLLIAWVGSLALTPSAAAQDGADAAPSVAATTSASTKDDYTLATGVTLAWTVRHDYGEHTWRRFMPESITYFYLPLASSLYLRTGARLGYAWIQQQMPQAVRIEETDLMISGEAGLLWDWYVVPALSFGAGIDQRTIKLKTEAPVDTAEDDISTKETLPFWDAQLGVGIPIASGRVVLEPFARYWNLKGDDRSHWTFGLETTVGIF